MQLNNYIGERSHALLAYIPPASFCAFLSSAVQRGAYLCLHRCVAGCVEGARPAVMLSGVDPSRREGVSEAIDMGHFGGQGVEKRNGRVWA
jgi:hypothetical protein